MNTINGIDLDGLAHEAPATIEKPDMVPGRVVHIDADFLAYQMSAERVDAEPMLLEDMQSNCIKATRTLKELAGAESIHLHLTPGTSNKGGRYEQAIQKEYQGNRIDKPKPRMLHIMRDWMGRHFPATLHQTCEADDGMSSAQYAAIKAGNGRLSIIASKDKDLRMVPGLHLEWDTGTITGCHVVNTFGKPYINDKGKVRGYGHSQFWMQMLTGDTADNIQGLPLVPGFMMNIMKPTAETKKAEATLANEAAPQAKKDKANATLASRKAGLCGPVLALEIISRCGSNKEAFEVVKELYKYHGEHVGFKHWKTGEDVPWNKVFVSEAQLLWMRKDKNDPMDVARWFKEILS